MAVVKKRLGDMLIALGEITQEQLEIELNKQKITGKRLGELFVEDGIVSENELLSMLEVQLAIPRVYLDMYNIDESAVKSIPEGLAKKYNLIPISYEDGKINVVMSDPLNIFALDDVKIASGCEVQPMIAANAEIMRTIDKYYSSSYVKKAAEELTKEHSVKLDEKKDINQEQVDLEDVKYAPVVKLVDSIIDNAVKQRASDIHIEPFEKYFKIRYRIDGELQEILRNPITVFGAFSTRIKILANLNIAEKRLPQDGRIITKVDGENVDLRISVLPTVHGEKIVIRILKQDNFLKGKEQLGLPEKEMNKLNNIIANPHGIILVTGPTGSGKSTTLYTLLNDLNKVNTNIVTVEDPVEYTMEGINQVNVNIKSGLTFATGLRSILRQDPDIIMIGEIRDKETAEIAVRAAITGHLVLSTIHTNDAPSTILRLFDMGIEPFLVGTSLVGIIAQRLVKCICPKCRIKYEANEYEKKILGVDIDKPLELYKGTGCKYCNNTGYKGRMGVFEIMDIDRGLRDGIMKGLNSDDLKDIAKKNEMKTLKDFTTIKVINGDTTIEELIKVTYIRE